MDNLLPFYFWFNISIKHNLNTKKKVSTSSSWFFLYTSDNVSLGTIYIIALLIKTILKTNELSLKLRSCSLSFHTGFCLFQKTAFSRWFVFFLQPGNFLFSMLCSEHGLVYFLSATVKRQFHSCMIIYWPIPLHQRIIKSRALPMSSTGKLNHVAKAGVPIGAFINLLNKTKPCPSLIIA